MSINWNDPNPIDAFFLLTLKARLSLEIKGINVSRGKSSYSIIKRQYNLKGSKKRVLEQYEQLLRDKGVLFDEPERT